MILKAQFKIKKKIKMTYFDNFVDYFRNKKKSGLKLTNLGKF